MPQRSFDISNEDDYILDYWRNALNALTPKYKVKKADIVKIAVAHLNENFKELNIEKLLSDKKNEATQKLSGCQSYIEMQKIIVKLYKEWKSRKE